MIVTFDREPCGWVHPLFRRQQPVHPLFGFGGLDSLVGPALETVDTLYQLLQLAQREPQANSSSVSSKKEEQPKSDRFEVKLSVEKFSPEELEVKLVDKCVVIEGKHEEKKDEQGLISRHFVRRYQLPDDVNPETVVCNLSSDGLLRVSAPRIIEKKQTSERTIPVNFTGPSAVESEEAKETPKGEEENKNSTDGEKVDKMEVSNAA